MRKEYKIIKLNNLGLSKYSIHKSNAQKKIKYIIYKTSSDISNNDKPKDNNDKPKDNNDKSPLKSSIKKNQNLVKNQTKQKVKFNIENIRKNFDSYKIDILK